MVSTELKYVSPQFLVCSVLRVPPSGLVVRCKTDELAIFNPPNGQTCAQWTGDFVDQFGGYIGNIDATSACRYCQYKVGNEYFEPLRMSFGHRWRDAFILFSFIGERSISIHLVAAGKVTLRRSF